MDPIIREWTSRCWRLPRTRGDGPRPAACWRRRMMASPHTRGWTQRGADYDVSTWGFPAHAGMDPRGDRARAVPGGLPRTRGDGPLTAIAKHVEAVASPHTRGWTWMLTVRDQGFAGFPAHAGMDPSNRPPQPRQERSPHTRGWTLPRPAGPELEAGFPAHAGMDPHRPVPRTGPPRLPRTRGDGPVTAGIGHLMPAASPHTRGWTSATSRRRGGRSGFPAHAGMDRRSYHGYGPRTRLPRTRGDGPRSSVVQAFTTAASPHTRGWTHDRGDRAAEMLGFPAHAGMDPNPDQEVGQ